MRDSIMLAALLAFAWNPAKAQDAGVPEAGYEVAGRNCASCHAILPGQGTLDNPPRLPFEAQVPLPFEDIANPPGITEMALFAWMGTSHPSMPNIVLEDGELRDLVAYILSLKRAS